MALKRFTLYRADRRSPHAFPTPEDRPMNQSSSSRVSRERRGHVFLIGLDRVAKRNAFDLDLLNALSLAYGEFEADSEARVAVVFAHGEHFTAGLDLVNASVTLADGWQVPPGGCDPWAVFAGPRVSKPVIVAAQGYCLTIGIELMLAADINLCASNTRFAQMEVQRGISRSAVPPCACIKWPAGAMPCAGC